MWSLIPGLTSHCDTWSGDQPIIQPPFAQFHSWSHKQILTLGTQTHWAQYTGFYFLKSNYYHLFVTLCTHYKSEVILTSLYCTNIITAVTFESYIPVIIVKWFPMWWQVYPNYLSWLMMHVLKWSWCQLYWDGLPGNDRYIEIVFLVMTGVLRLPSMQWQVYSDGLPCDNRCFEMVFNVITVYWGGLPCDDGCIEAAFCVMAGVLRWSSI